MKELCTELIFVLDRSGSMSGLEESTIDGYNQVLDKQRKEAGSALVSTILFDDESVMLYQRENMKTIRPLTKHDYVTQGCTALLDAVGSTIHFFTRTHLETPEESLPDKTLMVIITDGMENSSREYDHTRVNRLISQKKEAGWEILFMGANIDAIKTAQDIGISEEFACDYHADQKGTNLNFEAINNVVSDCRSGYKIDRNWKNDIESDYKRRKKQD